MSPPLIVLPRPGAPPTSPKPPIRAPTEEAFTSTFGALLPPATYLHTPHGTAAYYSIPPSANDTTTSSTTPSPPKKVLLIHGVQTPALGLHPLAHALHASFPHAHLALPDLWGHGLSDTPVAAHAPALFHALLDAVLEDLGWGEGEGVDLVGYSFGGALTVGYVAARPGRVRSYVVVAPAGLMRAEGFGEVGRGFLRGGGDEEEEAAGRWVVGVLEGEGGLCVPADWRERVGRGEVVAEAVREWQVREHRGHAASVVGVFRDGGVMDGDAEFVRAVGTGVPALAVLGGLDGLCSEGELRGLGFGNVRVLEGVGHGVVRERVPEVAALIGEFWRGLGGVE